MKRLFVMILIFMFLSIGFSVFCGNSSAFGAAVVTVSLDQAEQTADVSVGGNGSVFFTGVVNCTMPVDSSVEQVKVTLEANAQGLPWSIEPSIMYFDRNHSQESFSVEVQVPERTSATTTIQLAISGRWNNIPGVLGSAIIPTYAMINVAQFYNFQVAHDEPLKTDEKCEIDFKIRNAGNGQDTFEIDIIEGETTLEDQDITVQISQSPIVIEEGFDQVCKITFNYPKSSTDECVVKIRFSSKGASGTEDEIYTEEAIIVPASSYKENDDSPGFEIWCFFLLLISMIVIFRNKRRK